MIRFYLNIIDFHADSLTGDVKDNYLYYTKGLEKLARGKNYYYLFSMGRFYIYHDSGRDYCNSNERRSLLTWFYMNMMYVHGAFINMSTLFQRIH